MPNNALLGVDFDKYDPNILTFISERSYDFWQETSLTTLQKLRDTLSTAIIERWTTDQLAAEITKRVFGDVTIENYERASLIARTETTIVINQATNFAYEQNSDIIKGRLWLTCGDGKVRPSHIACEAQGMIPLNGVFVNGLRFPGDPNGPAKELCNCRCTQAPVIKSKDELLNG